MDILGEGWAGPLASSLLGPALGPKKNFKKKRIFEGPGDYSVLSMNKIEYLKVSL